MAGPFVTILPVLKVAIPYGARFPMKGTVEDENGDPLQRKIAAYKTNSDGILALASTSIVESEVDGTFEIPINEKSQLITLVASGENGENDEIFNQVEIGV